MGKQRKCKEMLRKFKWDLISQNEGWEVYPWPRTSKCGLGRLPLGLDLSECGLGGLTVELIGNI